MIAFALNPKNPNNTLHLPTDAKERKAIPLFSGLINYFPDALVAIAKLSQAGNDQHNPGQPLHWAREKSSDHEDTLVRHLFDSGSIDVDGHRHSTKVAWRALAILQLEIEKEKQAEAKRGNMNSSKTPVFKAKDTHKDTHKDTQFRPKVSIQTDIKGEKLSPPTDHNAPLSTQIKSTGKNGGWSQFIEWAGTEYFGE